MSTIYVTETPEQTGPPKDIQELVQRAKSDAVRMRTPSIDEMKVIARVAARAIAHLDEHLDAGNRAEVRRHVDGIIGLGVMLAAWTTRRDE